MPLYLKNAGVGEVELKEGPVLEPEEGQILVKVVAVGGNPVDRELNDFPGQIVGSTIGQEYAGIVASLGPGVTKFQPGDRVAGFNIGGISEKLHFGAFGEYCIGFEHVTFKIPDGMSEEEAATLPTALVVTGLGLYQILGVPPPGVADQKEPVLIWGGSSTMGSMALQFAKASGVSPIITTASSRNFDLVKSLGADFVVDYNDPEFAKKVKEYTGNKLSKAFDGYSHGDSAEKITECMGEKGGTVVCLNPTHSDKLRPDVKYEFLNSFMVFGNPFTIFSYEIPAVPAIKDFIGNWFDSVAVPLLNAGKIKPHRTKVMPGGLNSVKAGWELYRDGKVSGEKLIYRIADTPGIQA
ncbi:chaperonin 10-like protein [Trichophaea hybrida]|nr:chaperonin 10-like protein [Trichophaea hybrida]